LPIAVDVIADMLTSSLIDPTEFENERPVILEELAMNDDDPHDVVHEEFSTAVLGRSPTRKTNWWNPRNNFRGNPRCSLGALPAKLSPTRP
jgi:hypothetical protein